MRDKIKNIFNSSSKLKKTFIVENVIIETPTEQLSSKIDVSHGLHFDNKMKKLAQEFLDFVAKHFDLENYPTIKLLSERNKGMTYGSFDPNINEILVYGKNRGFADILRTAAHELTHFWQKETGKISADLKGRDHSLEAEANTQAGDLVYMFGLQNPEIYQLGVETNTIETPID